MADKDLVAKLRVEQEGDVRPLEEAASALDDLDRAGKKAGDGLDDAAAGADRADKEVGQLEKSIKKTSTTTSTAGTKAKGFVASFKGLRGVAANLLSVKNILAGLGLTSLFTFILTKLSETVEKAGEQVGAIKQIEAAIESTGGAAGLTSEDLQKMAAGLQSVTTFGDETILTGQSILLTFTSIGEEIFPLVTETALDMSTRLKQDLNSSVTQLGKALNNPIQGLTALSRVGVAFTESQKEQIRVLVESGDVLGAQKIILQELQVEFGGAARAARDTFAGSLDAASNSAGDFLEQIGEGGLSGALRRLADDFTSAADSGGSSASVIGQVLGSVVEVFGLLVTSVKAGFETISGVLGLFFGLLTQGVASVVEVVGQVLEKIPGLADVASTVQDAAKRVREVSREFTSQTEEDLEASLRRARDRLGRGVDDLVGIWSEGAQKAQESAGGYKEAADGAAAAADGFGALSDKLGDLPEKTGAAAVAAQEWAANAEDAGGRVVTVVTEAGEVLITTTDRAKEMGLALKLEDAEQGEERLRGARKGAEEAGEAFASMGEAAKEGAEGIRSPAELLDEVNAKVAALSAAEEGLAGSQKEAAAAAQEQAGGIQALSEALLSGKLSETIAAARTEIESLNKIDLSGARAELDSIIAKATEVRQALANMDALPEEGP